MAAPRLRCAFPFVLLALVLLAGCADDAEAPGGTGTRTPAGTAGGGVESVGIVFPDGLVLSGTLYGSQNDVGVVLAHMRRADQTAWGPFAEQLAADGYAVLTFDFRGYGASGGSEDFGALDDDLREAVRYLRTDRGKQQTFVIGASMGGTAALAIAPDSDFQGVVSISAPSEFEGQDALSAVPQITEPKLFIASEDDTAAMLSLDDLFQAAAEPKERQTYPGTLHGTDLVQPDSAHAQEVHDRILRFLQDNGG